MKTFLEFLSEDEKKNKPGVTPNKGTPVLVSGHGKHSRQKSPIVPSKGTPVIVDSHGKHSKTKIEESLKRILEDYDDDPENAAEDALNRDSHYNGGDIKTVVGDTSLPEPQVYKSQSVWAHHNDNKHIGSDSDAVGRHLHRTYSIHKIPNFEHAFNYTVHSKGINEHLFKSYKNLQHPSDDFDDNHLPSLDAAVNHHELHHPLHVYSGVRFHPGEEAAKNKGSLLHLPAFTSSSVSKHQAAGFAETITHDDGHKGKHILHIMLPKGHKGLFIGQHSNYPEEKEFIIPRGTTLKVNPKPSTADSMHYAPLHIWHCSVVGNEPETDDSQLKLHFNYGKQSELPFSSQDWHKIENQKKSK